MIGRIRGWLVGRFQRSQETINVLVRMVEAGERRADRLEAMHRAVASLEAERSASAAEAQRRRERREGRDAH